MKSCLFFLFLLMATYGKTQSVFVDPPLSFCHTFNIGDSMTISFCKMDMVSQLAAWGPDNFWLGSNAPGTDYSNMVIILSQPVTSINFLMSHFNHNADGGEFIGGFKIYDENKEEIRSPSIDWQTGSKASDSSVSFATHYNKKTGTIHCSPGSWGPEAAGKLYVSSATPFTRLTIHQEIIYGKPNGILVSKQINYTQAIPPPVVKVETTLDSIPQKNDSVALAVDSLILKKETTPLATDTTSRTKPTQLIPTVEKKEAVKATVKTAKEKTSVNKQAVKKVPVKKISPQTTKTIPLKAVSSQRTVAKTQEKKNVVKKEPAAKTIKSIPTHIKKAPVKKKTTAPALVPQQAVHALSQARSVEVGEKIKLERVFFKQSLSELLPESYPELDTLVNILKEQKTLEIEIQGHTDNQGFPNLNIELSEKRVAAVKAYLVSKGIAPERLTGKGFGASRPYTDNDIEEHRRQNRRVEFMITKR